ncbi:hypothetical protein T10_3522 [Trichinella papuae]|uniref:Uncharacterized protein n=1 Tax=Trichinella papuae TaxID=268474 RepID=A0A0V1MFI7_9BILA|nr:hypothetical protein T10_4504 [Trichinella papuae]KRZ70680.1 hypothetical protein T10_3522 [Trichinella papuae]
MAGRYDVSAKMANVHQTEQQSTVDLCCRNEQKTYLIYSWYTYLIPCWVYLPDPQLEYLPVLQLVYSTHIPTRYPLISTQQFTTSAAS